MAYTKAPNNIYALFANGKRMTGSYGKLYFDRKSARTARSEARGTQKWSGFDITLMKLPVESSWQSCH